MGITKNDMTKSIHTFLQFSYIVSKSHLVLCDPRGMKVAAQVQTLIHSHIAFPKNAEVQNKSAYWDSSLEVIQELMEEHKVCSVN